MRSSVIVKIMVFLHGTNIVEENGVDLPIGNAARKLRAWRVQGAEIVSNSSEMIRRGRE